MRGNNAYTVLPHAAAQNQGVGGKVFNIYADQCK